MEIIKESFLDLVKIVKQNPIKILIGIILLSVCGIFSIREIGIKDGATFTASVLITGIILIIGKNDSKKAMYLFIATMPVLVTARKLLYLDIYILKLNFESIILVYLFLVNFKKIRERVQEFIKSNKVLSYGILFFIIASYLSLIFADNLRETLALTTTSILLPVSILLISITIFTNEDVKNIVYALIISLNFSCFYGGIQILGIGLDLNTIRNSRAYLSFGYHNVNIFVNIAILIFPLLLNELLYKEKSKNENIFLILSGIIQGGALVITFSRGAWLALGIVIVAIFFSRKYKIIFSGLFIVALLGSSVYIPTILSRGTGDVNFYSNTSNVARLLSIETSSEILKDNLFGVGINNFNDKYREYVIEGYYNFEFKTRTILSPPLYSLEHPHNFFLAIAVEQGVVGIISIILIFLSIIFKGVKYFDKNRGLLISILMFIFIGVTTGIELNHKGVITNMYIFWLIVALILIQSKYRDEIEDKVI